MAFQLLSAIKKFRFAEIEQLVSQGQDTDLLTVTDKNGNTFLHLVTLLMDFHFLYYAEWFDAIDSSSSPQLFQVCHQRA